MEFVYLLEPDASPGAAEVDPDYRVWVRMNLFQRQRDFQTKATIDSRLLLATVNEELFPLECVRGFCHVRHRSLIGDGSAQDLATYKRQEDRFYFTQLFDRYVHRYYDVMPSNLLRNAPADVISVIQSRFSFIFFETGLERDLTQAPRTCDKCKQWASMYVPVFSLLDCYG